jgi:hypothetical protein
MGFFNSGNSPVYLYDPTSSDIIKLNDQATPPIPEPGRLIIFSKIIEGKQKIFSIDSNAEEKELGVDALKIIENHFLMGGANGQPENKSVNEIKTILGIEQIESDVISLSSQFSASDITAVSGSLEKKVDKVKDADGNEIKHLSTNDFSDEEKQKIEQNRLDILDKVDKQAGYQLTQEDFTSVLRALLVNIGDVAPNSIKIGDENGIGNNITFNQFKEDFGINNKVDKEFDIDGNEIKQLSTNDFTDIYKSHIDNLLAIVNTTNEDLDTFAEIIAYIQANKSELDSLSISSIIGLEDALNSKSDESNNYIKTLDNRNAASTPLDNLGKLSLEFKSGANANLNTNYAGLLTITPYTDTSAGALSHQFGFNENGLFYRKSNSDHTAWSDWQGFVYSSSDGSLNLEGDLNFKNGRVINAKNSQGDLQTFIWPRWTDDVTYLNYGENGFAIRNFSSQSAIFIKDNGNVGINNANPQHKLDVSGDIAMPYGTHIKVNNTSFGSKNILGTRWNGGYDVTELYAPGAVNHQRNFTISVADSLVGIVANPSAGYKLLVGGNVGATAFNQTSDEKLKENIKDIDINFIDTLSKIELKSYHLKDDEKKNIQFGVIAQQLEKIGLEQLVNTADHSHNFEKKEDAEDFILKKAHLKAKIEKFKNKKQKKVFEINKKEFEKIDDAILEEGDLQGKPSQIQTKNIDYEVDNFKCVWQQKSVNYTNLFILQQALINDQQSILRTQGLSFLIDDIKEVYNNEYNNTYEVLTIQGDLIKSIEKNGNTQQQRIDVWVSNGGKVKPKTYNNDEARTIIKEKAEELILEKYSRDDQRNIDRECLHLKAVEGIDPKRLSEDEKRKLQVHKDMGAYIESILEKCKKLKNDSEKLRNGKLQTLVKSVMDGSAYEGII